MAQDRSSSSSHRTKARFFDVHVVGAKGRCGGGGLLRDEDGHKVTAKQQGLGKEERQRGRVHEEGRLSRRKERGGQRGEGKASTVMRVQRALEKGVEEDKEGGGGGAR